MGADFFPEGGRMPQKLLHPKNDSRGGDTFCPPRGGVEGVRGGTNQIFAKENRCFCENMNICSLSLCVAMEATSLYPHKRKQHVVWSQTTVPPHLPSLVFLHLLDMNPYLQ